MPEMTQIANPAEVMCHCPSVQTAVARSPEERHDTVLRIPLSAGLDQGLRAFAKSHGIQPETAAAKPSAPMSETTDEMVG